MKKAQFVTALMLFAAAPSALHANPEVQDITIVSGDWHPYTHPNFNTETEKYIDNLLILSGYQPEWFYAGFDFALEHLRQGKAKAAFPYYLTEERQESFLFSDPVMQVRNVVAYNRQNPRIHHWHDTPPSPESLRSSEREVIFGLVRGYSYSGLFETEPPDSARWYPSEMQALSALLAGEIDALPIEQHVWQSLQLRHQPDRYHMIRFLNDFHWDETLHVIAPDNDTGRAIIESFNNTLDRFPAGSIDLELNHDVFSLIEEIERGTVRLNSTPLQPVILAYSDRKTGDSTKVVVPEGTAALVLDWAEEYFIHDDTQSVMQIMKARTQVLLLNGPHAGKTVYVENAHIEIN
jgi:polar amino acid transport system substrate-binding protein